MGQGDEPLPGFLQYRQPVINSRVRAAAKGSNIEVACDEDRAGK
ncbi:hypothetical protein [Bradyrhizobium sp. CCBAU 45389]|nr:hypothetical protein [Bradyrhizobium sp. CCBAU 45389]